MSPPHPITPIRLVHTSDWHLGHELHGHGREHEHDAFLAWLLDRLEDLAADALVMTGDVYDVASPPVSAMERLYGFLRDALARCPKLQVVMVGGNHDSAARVTLPAALLGRGRVHLVGCLPRAERALDLDRLLVPLANRAGETAALVAAVPYCRPGDLGAGNLASLYAEVVAAGAERAGGLPLIVTGHLHLSAGDVSEESERRIVIGGEEAAAASLFDARPAYVALGHLHKPQAVAADCTIRYAGSPIPLSATERTYRHSIAVVDCFPGETRVELLTIPRAVDFLSLPAGGPAPLADVLAAIEAVDLADQPDRQRQPFVEVQVLLDRPEPGLHARVADALRDKPCRLTRVKIVAPASATGSGIAAQARALDELKPDAVFAELHARAHGGPPEEGLARAFAELLIAVETEDRA